MFNSFNILYIAFHLRNSVISADKQILSMFALPGLLEDVPLYICRTVLVST